MRVIIQKKGSICQILIIFSFIIASHNSVLAAAAEININKNPIAIGHYLYYGLAEDFSENEKQDLEKIDLGEADFYVVSNLQEGSTYYFAATAYDNYGNESVFSDIWSYTVPGNKINGSKLAGFSRPPSPNLNLSSEGTSDWAHWGLSSVSSFSHKLKAFQQISNFTGIGYNLPKRFTDGRVAYSWNLGTPTIGSYGTTTGICVEGLGNGYQLTVPADTTARTFRIYIGSHKARGRLEAFLSDGSVAPYVENVDNPNGSINRVVTLNYNASGPSGLIVKYTLVRGFGNITLQAATLSETAPGEPATYTISASAGNGGNISPSGNVTVSRGANQSFIITPNPGKKIQEVMVNGKPLAVMNRVTFGNVMSNLTISVNFETIPNDSNNQFVEMGEVFVDQNWQRVDFQRTFIDPIVVAKPASLNDPDPAVVRISCVDETGFDIRIQEWDYLDGVHDYENVSYMVVEKGSYILPGGIMMEAGTFEADGQSFLLKPFVESFNHIPVVLASVTSANQETAVDGRINKVSVNGFEYFLQEQELNNQRQHGVETVSFIALEPFSGVLNGLTIEVGTTGTEVGDNFHYFSYTENFLTVPHFLADTQTVHDLDTSNVRYLCKDRYGVEVHISEEPSTDAELMHLNENTGYIIVAE